MLTALTEVYMIPNCETGINKFEILYFFSIITLMLSQKGLIFFLNKETRSVINERVDISDSTLSGDLPACGHVYVRESQGKTYGNIFF